MEQLNVELIFVSEAALRRKPLSCQNIKMSERTAVFTRQIILELNNNAEVEYCSRLSANARHNISRT